MSKVQFQDGRHIPMMPKSLETQSFARPVERSALGVKNRPTAPGLGGQRQMRHHPRPGAAFLWEEARRKACWSPKALATIKQTGAAF